MGDPLQRSLGIGIGGLGAIGMPVAKWLNGGIAGLHLGAVSAGNRARAEERVKDFTPPPPVVGMGELADTCDVVIECAPPELFMDIAEPAVSAGRIFMPLSVTSLLENMDLIDRCTETGARIIIPTGALVGFDAVRGAAKGEIRSVVMRTSKPPKSLRTAKFVVEQGLDLDALEEPSRLYAGSVRDAASKFPANVNVAVALSFAGIGVDRTDYEIWADPGIERNTHTIEVDADSTRFEMTIAGVPTEENPGTGKLTPLSVMATLEGLVSPLKVGT